MSLPFNPVKLVLLIIWVYVCLYFVQVVQFSPLIPKKLRPTATVVTLFTGPLLLILMAIVQMIRTLSESPVGIAQIPRMIVKQLGNMGLNVKRLAFMHGKDDSTIRLLDSSGRSIKEIYGHGKAKRQESRILDLTEQLIWDALQERASDILIDPEDESFYTVRLRVDGILRETERIKVETCKAVINSIKAVSNMDIAEKRRPQDGAFIAKTAETTASFRVASAGVVNGEKLSVRILNQYAGQFTLDDIGVTEKQRGIIKEVISRPSGMVLLCGPTGSGKTTTLYSMLNEIDRYTRNVITVEDPIECVIANTSQIEVNPKADITFANTLRSILRQDPDVICVGEIRDEATAGMALKASQTGHLVLATVHSNSTASALIRLLDLGVTPMLLSSGLDSIVSQRLLRKLCEECKVPAELSKSQIMEFHKKKINYSNIFEAMGCSRCHGMGYYGRTAIFDILTVDDKLKNAIANDKVPIEQLRDEGDRRGKSNLKKQGLKKVVLGITSLEELKRVLG